MRYLLILLFGFLGVSAIAQTPYPGTGSPTGLNTYKGGLGVDSFFSVPKRDTSAWFGRHSDFINQGGKLKYRDGNEYKEFGSDASGIHWSDTNAIIATHTFIHQSTIQSVTITGDSLKTATFTRGNNSFIATTFVDKDNQTLAYNTGTKMLSIHNGNSITLPIDYGELQQVITGQTSPVFTLSQPINTAKHLVVVMNTGTIDPVDYSVTGINQITLHFPPHAKDRFLFYYKEN